MTLPSLVDIRRYASRFNGGGPSSTVPFASLTRTPGTWRIEHDALGQMPIHYLVRERFVYVANTVKDLMLVPGYRYEDTLVLPHGCSLIGDEKGARPEQTINFFDHIPGGFEAKKLGDIEYTAGYIRRRFDEIADEIFAGHGEVAGLLSGGVDSMLATYLLSRRREKAPTYNLGLSDEVEDVHLAREYSKAFGLDYRFVEMTPDVIRDSFRESIWRSEIYHLYNVYCAVGMLLLGRRLAADRIGIAVSGEGANEAFGDYHNWTIRERDGSERTIQTTDNAFSSVRGRHAYVWGNPVSAKMGFVNRQLGSGLAKHGVTRMYKPLYEYGVQLLSPFMNVDVLRVLASIEEKDLDSVGGKTGFMRLAFDKDVREGAIPASFLTNRKKTRLQDANPHGQGGITEIMLSAGFGQSAALQSFNDMFFANVREDSRFTKTELR